MHELFPYSTYSLALIPAELILTLTRALATYRQAYGP